MIKKFLKNLGLTVLSLVFLLSLASVVVSHSYKFRSLIVFGNSGLNIRAASKIVNNGTSEFLKAVTIGTDGNGVDLTLYTDTATEEFLWDASLNKILLDGANGTNVLEITDGNVSVTDDLDVDGTTNLDVVDIDGAVQIDATVTVGVDGTGVDVTFFTTTSTEEMLWDASDGALELDGTDGSDVLTISDGNITLTDDMNIDGVLTTDGINASSIIVVDSSPYTVLAANTGMIHTIADLGQDTTIDLPTAAAGLNYEFWYVGGADEGHDHTIDTGSNTNFFIGGIAFADTDAGDAADEINAGIYSDGDSNSKLKLFNLSAGSRVKMSCDGTNWFLNGVIIADTIPTLAD